MPKASPSPGAAVTQLWLNMNKYVGQRQTNKGVLVSTAGSTALQNVDGDVAALHCCDVA